jgi:hypothetical protein
LVSLPLLDRDFDKATVNLTNAYQIDPDHHGIQKNLGLAFIWSGEPASGISYLKNIPEAGGELSTYRWWWDTQGRNDLSRHAVEAARMMDTQLSPP